jgi:hypothetical protein
LQAKSIVFYRQTIAANTQTLFAAAKSHLHINGGLSPVATQVARSEALADYYSARIPIDVSHLYVAQSLLPFLWGSSIAARSNPENHVWEHSFAISCQRRVSFLVIEKSYP